MYFDALVKSLETKKLDQNKPTWFKGFPLTWASMQIKVFNLTSNPVRQLVCFQIWNMISIPRDDSAIRLPLRGTRRRLKVEFEYLELLQARQQLWQRNCNAFTSVTTWQHFCFKQQEKINLSRLLWRWWSTKAKPDLTGEERDKINPVPLQNTLKEPQFPVWSTATGVKASLCSWKLLFTPQVLMSLLQFSGFGTFIPDRLCEKNRASLRPLQQCHFEGMRWTEWWAWRPVTNSARTHRTPGGSAEPTGWMRTRHRGRGIREKGTRVGAGSPEAAEFYFCAGNKLLHAVVSVASGNGICRKNQQHWVWSHLAANDSSLSIRCTGACYFNGNTT